MNVDADRHSVEFWEALGRGETRVPRCGECRRLFFPPLGSCPNCGATAVGLETVSGRLRAYSWVTVHRALDPAFEPHVPYTLITASLEEEPSARLVGVLVEGEAQSLRDGAPLEVVPLWRDGNVLPGMRPLGEADSGPDPDVMMSPMSPGKRD